MRILSVLLLFSFSILSAQNRAVDDVHQIIVQLEERVLPRDFFDHFFKKHQIRQASYLQTFSERYRLSLMGFDPNYHNDRELIGLLEKEREVVFASVNRQATLYDTPDDPDYSQQLSLNVINAPEVWDFTTGGVTPLGDTIVVATMESCDTEHEDLRANIWKNYGEIPNNGIDDDANGYVDDYNGYNTRSNNDVHEVSSHGTRVCGIIGAEGDNGIGVTGVNWNTKVMVVSNQLFINEIISAYEYVLEQRMLYNNTNGEKGAFVVATNASFGFDNQFPEESPDFLVWCDLFQDLGEAGVLSVVASNNSNILLDTDGDVPSFCPSNYLVAVTNTDVNDVLYGAYSPTHIDLAAPGRGSYSTLPNNEYGTIGGTSASTPHVAGAIGLLYSAPCTPFAQLARTNPASAALTMKGFILNGVTPVADLADKTVTGGRLHIENSLSILQEFCDGGSSALEITNISPTLIQPGVRMNVQFVTPDEGTYRFFVTDAMGRILVRGETTATTFGANIIQLDTDNMTTGIYYFVVENNQDVEAKGFLVY